MKKTLITYALAGFALLGVANAQTGSGTLAVTATVAGSVNLTFVSDSSGITLTGSGTSTATLPFGTVKMYGGAAPSGLTKTLSGTTSFSLATPFDVRVDLANSASETYTLTATLSAADTTNTWLIGATDISAASVVTLSAEGAYATPTPYTLHLTIPATEAAGAVSNSIGFTAVGN